MYETMNDFAKTIAAILKTDRWVFLVSDGDMGEGKSCFTSKLAQKVAQYTNTDFSYDDNMTYSRKELKKWIDGDNGKGQKPEYSTILADEIISMFFKRNWYDKDQIDGIELLNKCRDRHLCVMGNLPDFWDLDKGIYAAITFRVHIFERGIAWVFRKDRNAFTLDKWHRVHNEKVLKKGKYNPAPCLGFVCAIKFDDWSAEEKTHYYKVRNEKRKGTEGQRAKDERYTDIKNQRNILIRLVLKDVKDMNCTNLAELIGLHNSTIQKIKEGILI